MKRIIEKLRQNNWDFKNADYSDSIHNLHPYPAKFIPEIPRKLIETIGLPKGTAILDPFCGSGTTLIEAQKFGYLSIGIDLNPIACLISRVKTNSLPKDFGNIVDDVVSRAKKSAGRLKIKDIPNLDHWFNRDVQKALNSLTHTIDQVGTEDKRDALRFILSSIIVKVSNQDSDTRYVAVKKEVSSEKVFKEFVEKASKLNRLIPPKNRSLTPVQIINEDTLQVSSAILNWPVGLIITSPPYPNAYEYWLYHKYRMWWLGFDPSKVKEMEIGARAHFFKRDHHTKEDFVRQMDLTFKLLRKVLIKGGYICLVIGRSVIHGQEIDNAKIIEDIADNYELKLVDVIDRNIALSRKAFNTSYGKIKSEKILIFKNRK